MRILALDTATENCSAALMIDGRVLTREVELERGHAELILRMVDELLAEAGVTLGSLDAIAFGRGPGGFTGVRLAATVTQGLAFGADVGVVPISDLRAVAQRAVAHDPAIARVLVCNDARMSEVYWGCFERSVDGLATLTGDEQVGKPATVRLPQHWLAFASVATPAPASVSASNAIPTPVSAAATPPPASSSAGTASPTPAGASASAPATPATTDPALAGAGRGFTAYAPDLRTAVPGVFAANDLRTVNTLVDATIYYRFLPRAAEIVVLALPEVAAGRLLSAEGAIPVYLRDNVAHVAQPKKPAG